jgi:elongation factor 2
VKTEVADSRIPIVELKALVPAIELKVFEEALRTTTSQILYCTSRFDGHQVIPEDPYNELSNAHAIVTEIRQRKGLKLEIPSLSQFHDRL